MAPPSTRQCCYKESLLQEASAAEERVGLREEGPEDAETSMSGWQWGICVNQPAQVYFSNCPLEIEGLDAARRATTTTAACQIISHRCNSHLSTACVRTSPRLGEDPNKVQAHPGPISKGPNAMQPQHRRRTVNTCGAHTLRDDCGCRAACTFCKCGRGRRTDHAAARMLRRLKKGHQRVWKNGRLERGAWLPCIDGDVTAEAAEPLRCRPREDRVKTYTWGIGRQDIGSWSCVSDGGREAPKVRPRQWIFANSDPPMRSQYR